MNKAEKYRNKKFVAKGAKKAKPRRNSSPMPAEQEPTLSIQQAIDLAVQHHNAGDLPKAENIAQQILQADLNQPVALHLLGMIAHQVGKNDIAVDLITKALTIKPDFVEAYNNLGLALQNLGQLDEAVESLCKAIDINPDLAETYSNLGGVFKELGKIDQAVASCKKAIAIKPDYAEAYSNLGNAFQELGKIDEAITSYNNAIAIKPDYAAAFYNQHATLIDIMDMEPSIECMKKAININPSNIHYRFMLGMILDYWGYPKEATSHFDKIQATDILPSANLDAWNYIKSSNDPLPPIIGANIEAFKIGMQAAVNEGLVLEFGVRFGTSIRIISELANQEVHGFDSFEGLPEAWDTNPKGSYSTKGIIPLVPDNVILHNGWFEETLPNFVDQHQAPIRFMNIDCDIFSSTQTILDLLAKQVTHGTVIVFDEYIGNYTWQDDEFKAFQEAVLKYGWKYEYLCFSFMTKQVAVRIN
jgi:tetratricopeptide (TPR) repeat protein